MTRQSTRKSGALEVERNGELEIDVPVFRPTIEEFKDFYSYMQKIEQDDAAKCGLVKVVPPYADWSWKMEPNKFETCEKEQERWIKPMKQFVGGRKGAYRLDLTGSKRRSAHDFRQDAIKHDEKRPSLARKPESGKPVLSGNVYAKDGKMFWTASYSSEAKKSNRRARKQGQESRRVKFELTVENTNKEQECFTWKAEGYLESPQEGDSAEVDQTASPTRQAVSATLFAIPFALEKTLPYGSCCPRRSAHVEGFGKFGDDQTCLSGEFTAPETSPEDKSGGSPQTEGSDDEEMIGCTLLGSIVVWFSDPIPGEEENRSNDDNSDILFDSSQYDLCAVQKELWERDWQFVETAFWDSLNSTSTPPIYGGDQSGTVFDSTPADGWNLNCLDSLLRIGFANKEAKGISTSMLYFGMWRAMFAWHTEDMELNSVNFVHYGAPKLWYCIPPEHASRFESVVRAEFGDEANRCAEFLRHKNIMISTSILKREKIPYVRAIQYPGEFMFTFPRSYHGGFNTGFNVAEAVNFATARWIDYGRKARWCKCENWTFRIDIDSFVESVRRHDAKLLPSIPVEGERVWLHYTRGDDAKGVILRKKGRSRMVPDENITPVSKQRESRTTTISRGRGRGGGSRGRGGGTRNRSCGDGRTSSSGEHIPAENDCTATEGCEGNQMEVGEHSSEGNKLDESVMMENEETISGKDEETAKKDTGRKTKVEDGVEYIQVPADWYLCRIKRGRRGAKFLATPVDKDDSPYLEMPFDPDMDEWKWPHEFEVVQPEIKPEKSEKKSGKTEKKRVKKESMKNDQNKTKGKSLKRKKDLDSIQQDGPLKKKYLELPEAVVNPVHEEHLRIRRIKWERLQQTRKFRLIHRRAKMFQLVQENPVILARMIARLLVPVDLGTNPTLLHLALQQNIVSNDQLSQAPVSHPVPHVPQPHGAPGKRKTDLLSKDKVLRLQLLAASRKQRRIKRRESAKEKKENEEQLTDAGNSQLPSNCLNGATNSIPWANGLEALHSASLVMTE